VSALSRIFVTDNSTCDKPSDRTCRLTHLKLKKANIGDKGLIILIKNIYVVSSLTLIGNDIHSRFGVSCLADAVCSGRLKLQRYGELRLSDNPLGLEGSIAVARIISSIHYCQVTIIVELSRCELTSIPSGTESLNTTSSVAERDIGQQLCQMPQSSTISYLELDGNSF
jgi:hypothetical protein